MSAQDVPSQGHLPLIGREREVGALRNALAEALVGRGSLMLIGGEAGVGKTTLAEATLTAAQAQGATALVGRCYDLAETPPYGPWVEALAHAPAGMPYTTLAAPLARMRDALAGLATSQVLVILLDDLQWADPGSLDLLRVVGRDLARLRILILVTYRADELTRHHPLYQLLPTLIREARAARLDLRPLSPESIHTLVVQRYGLSAADGETLAAYLLRRTEGNPFFLGEVLRTLEAEDVLALAAGRWVLRSPIGAPVPVLLRQMIDGRLAHLPEEGRDLLESAAILGQEISLADWSAVTGASDETIRLAMTSATAIRVLVETPDGAHVRFAHALVREALYEQIAPARRREGHRAVAETLAALPAPDPDAVAYHYQQSGDARAVEWLVRAGDRAQRAYAWRTAIARFEAARALMGERGDNAETRGWLLYRLARLYRYADPGRGIAAANDAARLAASAGDAALAACVLFSRGNLRCMAGDLERGVAELAEGTAALDGLEPAELARLHASPDARGLLLAEQHHALLALWLGHAGRYGEARSMAERVVAAEVDALPSQGQEDVPIGHAYHTLGHLHAAQGRPEEARRAYRRAREAFGLGAHQLMVGATIRNELLWVHLPYQAERRDERRTLAAEGEAAWRRAADIYPRMYPRVACLPQLWLEGQWDEAWALAVAAQGTPGDVLQRQLDALALGELARARGDAATAWAMVRQGLPDGPATRPGAVVFRYAIALQRLAASLALDGGDLGSARSWLGAHDRWLATNGTILGQAEGELLWAAYHRAAGDGAAARRFAGQALARAAEPRQPLALLAAHRAVAELDTAAGRFRDASDHIAAAMVLADTCAVPYERALTLLALARLHAARRDRQAMKSNLMDVRSMGEALGAAPLLAQAADLERHLGAVPSSDYPGGLSAREVEVLRLVAAGLTDHQAAERLFLSPRTVGQHLRSIYNKLGVSSRAAAARFATDHGLA